MKFTSTLLVAALASTISASLIHRQQGSSSSVGSATPVSVSMTPQQTCISACKPGDVTCQAACVGTAHPNESQVNATTQCAMKCDQGDGSPAATQKYAACQQACIASYFPTSGTLAAPAGTGVAATPAQTTGAGASAATPTGAQASQTGNASGSGSSPSGTGSSPSRAASGSGSAASASPTGAASANGVFVPAAGLGALIAAVFAL